MTNSTEFMYLNKDDTLVLNHTFTEAGSYRLIAHDFADNESVYDFEVYADAKVKIIDVNIYDYKNEADAMGIRDNYLPVGWCTEELYKYSLEDNYWKHWNDEYKSVYDKYEYVCSTFITVSTNEADNVIYRFFVPSITVKAEYVSPNKRITKFEIGKLNISHYGYVRDLYIMLPDEYAGTSWTCADGTNISLPMSFALPADVTMSEQQKETTIAINLPTVSLENENSIDLYIPSNEFEDNTLKITIIAYRGQPCELYRNATSMTQANCDVMVTTINLSEIFVPSTSSLKLKWCIGSYGGWKFIK